MDFNYNGKKYDIKVKHISEYYDEYLITNNIEIFEWSLDDDGIFRRTTLKWLFDYLVKSEEYEKCVIVDKLMKKYYVGDEKEQIRLHTKLEKLKKERTENKSN